MKKWNIPFSPPDLGQAEIDEVVDTLKSGWITTGPKTKKLEVELSSYTQTPRTVCLNSATAALELILRVLGIGPGDEVIVPALTYTASCAVIEHVGATPVLVDLQSTGFEMDYDLLAASLTAKTKAVIPVEIAGIPCDYDKLMAVLEAKKELYQANPEHAIQALFDRVIVISDSAHALGATYKGQPAGTWADFTSFSFHAVKNFTTAEGGSVTWKARPGLDDDELYRLFQVFSLHGQTKDALAKTQLGAWEYDIVIPGFKCNMTDIMASIGLVQLQRYPGLLARRKELVAQYDQGFAGTPIKPLPHQGADYESSRHLYITHIEGASLEDRNRIITLMAERGIATNVHYKPLPLLTAYANMGFKMADYPNAYAYYENEITLPLHTRLTDEEVAYIIESFREVVAQVLEEGV